MGAKWSIWAYIVSGRLDDDAAPKLQCSRNRPQCVTVSTQALLERRNIHELSSHINSESRAIREYSFFASGSCSLCTATSAVHVMLLDYLYKLDTPTSTWWPETEPRLTPVKSYSSSLSSSEAITARSACVSQVPQDKARPHSRFHLDILFCRDHVSGSP